MTLNTNLDDLSDVTDEAIDAALGLVGITWHPASFVRERAEGGSPWVQLVLLLARCIQSHYPEMIVDPVTLKAREICAAELPAQAGSYLTGRFDDDWAMRAVKRALAGMEMERGK